MPDEMIIAKTITPPQGAGIAEALQLGLEQIYNQLGAASEQLPPPGLVFGRSSDYESDDYFASARSAIVDNGDGTFTVTVTGPAEVSKTHLKKKAPK